jgi:hypothetical protein
VTVVGLEKQQHALLFRAGNEGLTADRRRHDPASLCGDAAALERAFELARGCGALANYFICNAIASF